MIPRYARLLVADLSQPENGGHAEEHGGTAAPTRPAVTEPGQPSADSTDPAAQRPQAHADATPREAAGPGQPPSTPWLTGASDRLYPALHHDATTALGPACVASTGRGSPSCVFVNHRLSPM